MERVEATEVQSKPTESIRIPKIHHRIGAEDDEGYKRIGKEQTEMKHIVETSNTTFQAGNKFEALYQDGADSCECGSTNSSSPAQ